MPAQNTANFSYLRGPIRAELNYIRPDSTIAPEVFYSGDTAPQTYNDAYAFMQATVEDRRSDASQYEIHQHGFQLASIPTQHVNFKDEKAIEAIYYKEVAAIVQNVTGAKDVFVFDHTVRFGEAHSRRKPAHHVHNDYTDQTALSRANEMMGEAQFVAQKGRRMIQINVWRPLVDVVQRSPLAFCDASSIAASDLIPTKIHFPDTDHVGEIYALRKNPEQRWSYFSEMTRDEVVLIKGYDTERSGCSRFTPHTAFEYPDQNLNAPPRKSIETRTFAFF